MRILGVDPGTAITGFGLVEANGNGRLTSHTYGAITTPSTMPLPERLYSIAKKLRSVIAEQKPDILSVEQLFFNKNTRTALAVGQARGVILLVGTEAGIPIVEYTPAQVKMAVTGHGRADKNQVQSMVKHILHLAEKPRPDDVADALAISICAHHSQGPLSRVAWR